MTDVRSPYVLLH